jgi:hypothetical protein
MLESVKWGTCSAPVLCTAAVSATLLPSFTTPFIESVVVMGDNSALSAVSVESVAVSRYSLM